MSILLAALESLSLNNLWQYVFNAMECHSRCCSGCMCDCETKEIEIKNERNCCDVCYLILECSDDDYVYDNESFLSDNESFLLDNNNIKAQ